MLAAAAVANIMIRYDAKAPQFAIFGTRVIYVFYSIAIHSIYVSETFSDFSMKLLLLVLILFVASGDQVHGLRKGKLLFRERYLAPERRKKLSMIL